MRLPRSRADGGTCEVEAVVVRLPAVLPWCEEATETATDPGAGVVIEPPTPLLLRRRDDRGECKRKAFVARLPPLRLVGLKDREPGETVRPLPG